MPSAPERLREAAALHGRRVAALPYSRALDSGGLPPEQQHSLLRALWIVHDQLARALGAAPAARAAVDERRGRLERALERLGVDRHGVDEAALAALVLAQQIRLAALRADGRLLGFAAALDAAPLARLVPGAALAPPAAPATIDDAALAGALATFEHLESVVGGAGRRARGGEWLATELNPDAGMHPVPADLREIEAAILAGEETWRAFAYYELRYGARGRQFTMSDAAWLVTLAREDPATTVQQVHWLARVLASRGMPRLTLEIHLGHLAAALRARVPERAGRYRSLDVAAQELREERTAALAEERARELVARFAAELAPEANLTPTEAATLVVAAVGDEAMNVAPAVKPLVAWLVDPARFSVRWRAAIERLVSEARSAALR